MSKSQPRVIATYLTTAFVVALGVAALVFIAACSDARSVGQQRLTLEEKLGLLANGGLKLAEPFAARDLLESFEREAYEQPGWDLTLVGLAMSEEREPWRNHCVNLWHFDTECIEDHGDYKSIAERMAEMTQGALELDQIEDYVDIEQDTAWLAFSHSGDRIKIDCRVEDDWVDEKIFGTFVELLEESDPSKTFIYYDLGGQSCILGCVSNDEFEVLKGYGINFVPLS